VQFLNVLQQWAYALQRAAESLPGMAKPADTPEQPASDNTSEQAEDDPSPQHRASGVITACLLFAILIVTALQLDGYAALWRTITGTFTGSLLEARVIDHSLLGLLGVLSAAVTFAIPLCVGSGILVDAIYGSVKSHAVGKMFSGISNHYLLMTATVAAEEVFARLLFLGVPLWLGDGHLSMGWFWALFLVGNSIWAVIHLSNYKDPKERHLLRVLPQFLGGVVFTVIFIEFGFFGALAVHLAYNNLLFSMMRKGVFNRGELVAILWHSLIAAVSAFFLIYKSGKSLLDMTYWLNSDITSYQIPGWSTMDYLWGVLLATSLLFIIGDLLQFDLYCDDYQEHIYDNLLKAVGVIVFAFGAFIGLQFLGTPFEMRVAVMALIFMVISRTASGSGMSRIFWIGIPGLMIQLCATLALGFASPVWLILLAVALVEAVDDVIRVWDRRSEEKTGSALALILPSRSK
jgi:hypothetical protein